MDEVDEISLIVLPNLCRDLSLKFIRTETIISVIIVINLTNLNLFDKNKKKIVNCNILKAWFVPTYKRNN